MAEGSMSDETLLKGFCAGNEECATKLVQQFWRRLCWIASGIVGDSASAEDVAQVALERAWRSGVMFDPRRGSLDAWMTTIARNAALDWTRVRRAIPIDPSEICAKPTSGSGDPAERAAIEESRAEIRTALASLSPVLVRSVVLAGALDMTAAEVAAHEKIPLGTAKSRIRAGKQRLRSQLDCLR
jgi:RNA polymerase sigma factor (sigma-70 family)